MVKLKNLLHENDDNINPQESTGKLVSTTGGADPYEYYYHTSTSKWYTKKRINRNWLDMQYRLIKRYGKKIGTDRYNEATGILQKYIDNSTYAAENNMVVQDVSIDPVTLEQNKIKATIPNDRTVTIDKLLAKDITVDIEDVYFEDKWIEVSAKRNPTVEVIAKNPKATHFRVILPKRGLFQRNVETWVLASDFDVSKQDTKFIGTYNGASGNRYEIYKPKQKDSE